MSSILLSLRESLSETIMEAAARAGKGILSPAGKAELGYSSEQIQKDSPSFFHHEAFKAIVPLLCLRAGTICGLDAWFDSKSPEPQENELEGGSEAETSEFLKKLLFRSMKGGELFEKIYDSYQTHSSAEPGFFQSLGTYLKDLSNLFFEEKWMKGLEKLFHLVPPPAAAALPPALVPPPPPPSGPAPVVGP